MAKNDSETSKRRSYFLSWQFFTPILLEITALYAASLSFNYYRRIECNSSGSPYILSAIIFASLGLVSGLLTTWLYLREGEKMIYKVISSAALFIVLSFVAIALATNLGQYICMSPIRG